MNNWLKIIAIVGFGLITIGIFLLYDSPAEGYELSIYSATPALAWAFLLTGLSIGLLIIIQQAFASQRDNFWLIGFLLAALAIFVILIIPPLRGYLSFGSGDSLVHVGIINDLMANAHLGEGNFYPITHILVTMISQISGISSMWSTGYLLPLISVLFMFSTYLLARVTLPQRGQALLVAATSALLFYGMLHRSLFPNAIGLLMLPLVFYFYMRDLKTPGWQNRLLLVLLLAFHVFLYPPISLAITVSLLLAELARWWFGKRLNGKVKVSVLLGPALISFVVLFLWASDFPVYERAIVTSWNWLSGEVVHLSLVASAEAMLSPLGIFELASLTLRMYGENIALVLLSLLAGALITKRLLHGKAEMQRPLLTVIFLAVFGIMSIVVFMATTRVSVGRFLSLNYAMWITPLLAGFCLYELFHNKPRFRIIVVTGILVGLSLVSIFGLYTSPNINQPSPHVTHMDMAANSWVINHGVPTYAVTAMGYSFDTIAGISGATPVVLDGTGLYYMRVYHVYVPESPEKGIPDHFGYLEHENIAASISERFLIITKGYREVSILLNQPNSKMYSSGTLGRAGFVQSDFDRLERDPSVTKLYASKEVDVWYVTVEAKE